MTAASAYVTWGILPRLRRAALRQSRHLAVGAQQQTGTDGAEMQRLQRQEALLLHLNLLLGVAILALTALARAS
jgi:hypothetical protein